MIIGQRYKIYQDDESTIGRSDLTCVSVIGDTALTFYNENRNNQKKNKRIENLYTVSEKSFLFEARFFKISFVLFILL